LKIRNWSLACDLPERNVSDFANLDFDIVGTRDAAFGREKMDFGILKTGLKRDGAVARCEKLVGGSGTGWRFGIDAFKGRLKPESGRKRVACRGRSGREGGAERKDQSRQR